jgi:hypothetical protein
MADTTEALLREPVRVGGNSAEAPEGAVVVNRPGTPVESSCADGVASGAVARVAHLGPVNGGDQPAAESEIDYEECLSCQ